MIPLDTLARPLTELLSGFGTGTLPADGPTQALTVASAALDAAYAIGKLGLTELGGFWSGTGADAAAAKGEQVQVRQVQLSEQGTEIVQVLGAASECVAAGLTELESIIASFVSTAVAAGPALVTPAGQVMILGAAIDHLSRGLAVVSRVRAELDTHTAAMSSLIPLGNGVSAPSMPSFSMPSFDMPSFEMPSPAAAARQVADFLDNASGMADKVADQLESGTTDPAALGASLLDTGSVGDSAGSSAALEVVLPDGSTATAPNVEAADAVRNALSQQGVPYSWGGTAPGQGLDCSGLTQWAYGEAGVDIPRLAQDQTVGTPVAADNLMPGDLAVWDGHVAMVIGNGEMVEAGDPVQVSPVRTGNLGMGFYGFYRPTT